MTLTIYMKSGNKIRLDGIAKWEVQARGNDVSSLTLHRVKRHWRQRWQRSPARLIMTSLDLSQIEAITEEDE